MKIRYAIAVCTMLLLSAVGQSAQAQKPLMPGTSGASGVHLPMHRSAAIGSGQIIGNKNSHVYHLPGDKSSLPAEKNRVYFHSEREAVAAGYHAAGSKKMTSSHTSHRTMQPSHSMTPGTTGSTGRMNGPGSTRPNGTLTPPIR